MVLPLEVAVRSLGRLGVEVEIVVDAEAGADIVALAE